MPQHAPWLSFALLVGLMCVLRPVSGWTTGRATFYDDNTEGACRYGRDIPTLYAAWPDGQDGAPACGQCYEVGCVNKDIRDGYGKSLSRSNACNDESDTVVVKVVDSCPCVHENFYSNQRWCCNDAPHIDLGRAAFKKLACESFGVVGARWRKVECPDSYGSKKKAISYASSAEDTRDDDDEDDRPVRRSSRSRSNRFSWFG